MTFSARLTESQKKRAYREAGQASLIEFYGVAEPTSRNLVKAWWKRISDTSAFKSGLFMHAEPINTSFGLSGIRHRTGLALWSLQTESRCTPLKPKEGLNGAPSF